MQLELVKVQVAFFVQFIQKGGKNMSMVLYDLEDMRYYLDRALMKLKIPSYKFEEPVPGQGLKVNRKGEFVKNGRLSRKQEIRAVIEKEYEKEEKMKQIVLSYDSRERYMELTIYGADGEKVLVRDGWEDDHHNAVKNFFYRL